MTRDSAGISTERRQQIGRAILEQSDHLIEQWERSSNEQRPETEGTRPQRSRGALPDFLRAFGEGLRNHEEELSSRYAVEHGFQCWEQGCGVVEVLRDFSTLRRCLVSHLRRELDLAVAEAEALAATFDEAIAAGVTACTEQWENKLKPDRDAVARCNEQWRHFTRVLAHEIRTPLGTVTMAARLLMRTMKESVPEELQMIQGAAGTIASIVDDATRYARLPDPAHDRQDVDLNDVFEEARARIASMMDEPPEMTADPLPTVSGHRELLLQVFLALIENGARFSDTRARLRVTARRENDGHIILFHDDGHATSPYHVSLFAPPASGHAPGSDILLALCRRVADLHDGDVWLEPHGQEGSAVLIKLPERRNDEQR